MKRGYDPLALIGLCLSIASVALAVAKKRAATLEECHRQVHVELDRAREEKTALQRDLDGALEHIHEMGGTPDRDPAAALDSQGQAQESLGSSSDDA